ncbi:EamA-like transporter family [Musa troglodytarum]|uniref:EamA-like transporter family n=1 Tax=Musa troglodytarum TaxID=320322 RepID=A0A9E7GSI9_9LILI|nr:EamA-like transporter family [Musa troglodytarum]
MGDSLLAECKPGLAMVVSQCIYAAMALSAKAAFARGMSPMVFSVYRQATAALVLAPINITARSLLLGLCCFAGWVSDVYLLASSSFQFSLPEDDTWNSATINQCFYYTGLSLSSSSMAMAMTNLTPAITFVIAAFTGITSPDGKQLLLVPVACFAVKGPLYSAMFNPLGTVITTISACLVLHEQLHIGSLVAAVAVVGGLYVVLWGKAKDIDPKSSCSNSHLPCVSEKMTVVVDPGLRESVCDLQKPLLRESLGTQDNQMED